MIWPMRPTPAGALVEQNAVVNSTSISISKHKLGAGHTEPGTA